MQFKVFLPAVSERFDGVGKLAVSSLLLEHRDLRVVLKLWCVNNTVGTKDIETAKIVFVVNLQNLKLGQEGEVFKLDFVDGVLNLVGGDDVFFGVEHAEKGSDGNNEKHKAHHNCHQPSKAST